MTTTIPLREVASDFILQRFAAKPSVRVKAAQYPNALDFLNALVETGDFESIVDYLAHWLPPQHAVWWGCLCAWDLQANRESEPAEQAMGLLLNWLEQPDRQREALLEVDRLLESKHPLSLLAKGAFFSGSSMAPAGLPVVPPPPYIYSILVSASVQLTVSLLPFADRASNFKQMIRLGMEVLQGTNLWPVQGAEAQCVATDVEDYGDCQANQHACCAGSPLTPDNLG